MSRPHRQLPVLPPSPHECSNEARLKAQPKIEINKKYIDAVYNAGRRLLITAPSKFGKTKNLKMFRDYINIENTKKLQHPVLYILFEPKKIEDYESVLESYKLAIHFAYLAQKHAIKKDTELNLGEYELYQNWCDYNKCKNFSEQHITHDLVHLVRILKRAYNRDIIVLIDEYDCIVNEALTNNNRLISNNVFRKTMNLTESILKNLLKGNKDVFIGVLTGVSSVVTKGLSEVDNMRIFQFTDTHEFNDCLGFTDMDLQNLYNKHNKKLRFWRQLRLVGDKQNHNRYMNKKGYYIYNPYYVLEYLKTGDLKIAEEPARVMEYAIHAIECYPEVLLTIDNILSYEKVTFKFTSKPLLQDLIDLRSSIFFYPKRKLWEINLDLMLSYLIEYGTFSRKIYPNTVVKRGDDDDEQINNDDKQNIDNDKRNIDDDDEERISISTPDNRLYIELRSNFQQRILWLCGEPDEFMTKFHSVFISRMDETQNPAWKKLCYKLDQPVCYEKPPSIIENIFRRFRNFNLFK